MAREYFNAYHSYLKSVEPLNDAERGRLFTALLTYSSTGAEPELHGNERFVFPTMRQQIDRDVEQYERKCSINRANGALGCKANGGERYRTPPERPPNAPQDKDKGEGEDKGKDKDKDNTSRASAFDAFWSAYPKKVGKGAAEKSFSKLSPSLLPQMLSAIDTQKKSDQWAKDNGQFIPNPTTWLNQRRWEDEVQTKSSGFAYNADFEEGTSL